MDFNLLVSQGRAADVTRYTIEGAAVAARALHERFGPAPLTLGTPSPPARDSWTESLPQAQATLRAVADAIDDSISTGKKTVLVSNTCSVSLASLPVMARHFPDAMLLWIDAHGDFNTPETTTTGYLGGMVVAAACGLWDSGLGAGLAAENVLFVGSRDIDTEEAQLINRSGARTLPVERVSPKAILDAVGTRKLWIHIDWDVLEPGYVPADYAIPGGLVPDQIRSILASIPQGQVLGLEIAEFHSPEDPAERERAVGAILYMIEPLFEKSTELSI